jgi:hypothetical protein
MSVVVVILQHLLNVFVQLANKRGLKKMTSMNNLVSAGTRAPTPWPINSSSLYIDFTISYSVAEGEKLGEFRKLCVIKLYCG